MRLYPVRTVCADAKNVIFPCCRTDFCNPNSKLHCQAFQTLNTSIGSIPKLSCNGPSGKEQVFCVCFSDAFDAWCLRFFSSTIATSQAFGRTRKAIMFSMFFRSKLNDLMDPQVFSELVCIPLYLRFLGGEPSPTPSKWHSNGVFLPIRDPKNESI